MLHGMTHMSKDHPLFREVLGLGNRIVIPNLLMDGAYGMSVFEKAGFCSLVAVPITTYKVIGILGAADKKKRRFGNDIAQLLSVIASLVGVSLTKTGMMQPVLPEKTQVPDVPNTKPDTDIASDVLNDSIPHHEKSQPVENETIPEKTRDILPDEDAVAPAKTIPRVTRNTDKKTVAFIRHAHKMGRFREQHH
jgi:hypothetical protein